MVSLNPHKNQNLKLIDTSLGMNYNYSIEELWLNPYNYLMMAKNIKIIVLYVNKIILSIAIFFIYDKECGVYINGFFPCSSIFH